MFKIIKEAGRFTLQCEYYDVPSKRVIETYSINRVDKDLLSTFLRKDMDPAEMQDMFKILDIPGQYVLVCNDGTLSPVPVIERPAHAPLRHTYPRHHFQ